MSKLKTFSTFTVRRRGLRGSLALGFVMILAISACSADSADEGGGAAQDDVSGETFFSLTSSIDSASVQTLTDEGKSVVIVSVVESSAQDQNPAMWTTADPAEQIDFEWSSGELEVFESEWANAGEDIEVRTSIPVNLGDAVKWDNENEKFTADGTGESSDGIEIELSQSTVVGLSNRVSVAGDDAGPMNIVQGSGNIVLTPTDEVYIFVDENAAPSRAVGEIPPGALKVDMTDNKNAEVTYDGTTGQFTLA